MKTAEQVADERIAENYDEHSLQEMLDAGHVDADGIRRMMVAAIKADREQLTPPGQELAIGDGVKLTGPSWEEFEMLNEEVTIEGFEILTGHPTFQAHGNAWVIYRDEDNDYSATAL